MGSGGYFGGLEQDLEGFETDDSSSEPGNEYDQSDSSDLQVRTARSHWVSWKAASFGRGVPLYLSHL
jgi:hypothetical protein